MILDAYQLLFENTESCQITKQWIQALERTAGERKLAVVYPSGAVGDSFRGASFQAVPVEFRKFKNAYLDRYSWSRAVEKALQRYKLTRSIFIPYAGNYAQTTHNTVQIPNFTDRVFPQTEPRRGWLEKAWIQSIFAFLHNSRIVRAKRIVAPSYYVAQQVHEYLLIPKERIAVVSWGIDANFVEAVDQAERPHGMLARYALYCGGYTPRHNVDLLLRVCGKMIRKDPFFRCVFIGLSDHAHQSEFRTLLEDEDIRNACILKPKVDVAELASLYRHADLIYYPSLYEGFPVQVLNACAVGKVCLCADNSSLAEVQTDAELRLNAMQEEAWLEATRHWWSQSDEARARGSQSRERVHRDFSWDKSAEQLWELWDQDHA